MSDKYCCITWEELVQELSQYKVDEINNLIENNKGLSVPMFATVLRVVKSMHMYCPVCGSGLTEETKTLTKAIPPRKVQAVATQSVTPAPAQGFVPCPQCQGKPSAVKCMTCRGKGKLKLQKPIDEDKLMALEELKEKKIQPYSAEAEAQQMKDLED